MQQILQVLLKIQTRGSKESRAPTQAWFSFPKGLNSTVFRAKEQSPVQGFHLPQQDRCKIMELDIFVSDLNNSHKPLKEPVCALGSNPSCHGTSPLEGLGLYLGSKFA